MSSSHDPDSGPAIESRQETGRLGWARTVAVSFAIVFVVVSIWTGVLVYTEAKGGDFVSYWAAAKLAADGTPALAYDYAAHRAVELTAVDIEGVLTFPYPPPYLVLITPFGLLPYWLAFAVWLGFCLAVYLACTRHVSPIEYRLAHPEALVNALSGQNGFLTTALFSAGTLIIDRRPFAAGMILGLFVMKPQLAIMLPIAVIAGRLWQAIAGAILSSCSVLILALTVFGVQAYAGFFSMLPFYTSAIESNRWPWNEFASVFAFGRYIGIPHQQALIIHAFVAVLAATLVWRAWRINSDRKVPILAAATLLASPYTLTYDALLLIVPLGWLVREQRSSALQAAIWLCCFLPIVTYAGFYPGPNPLPLAALLCLWTLSRREFTAIGSARVQAS